MPISQNKLAANVACNQQLHFFFVLFNAWTSCSFKIYRECVWGNVLCTTTFFTLFRLKFDWLKKLSCKNDLGDQLNEPTKIKMGKNEESFCGTHSIIREFSMGCIIIKKMGTKVSYI